MYRQTITLIIFLALQSIAFSQTESSQLIDTSVVVTQYEKLNDELYTITYPSEWEIDTSGLMGTTFMIFSPLSSSSDIFRENVNLIEQNLTDYDLDLDQFIQLSTDQVKTVITDCNIESSVRINDTNLPYHKMIYTGSQGIYKVRFVQYIWLIDDLAYVLTFTSELEAYDAYKMIGEEILNSFQLKSHLKTR